MTAGNTYWMLQLPHAALLHWASSAAFTLNLQLALKRPAVRQVRCFR